MKKIVFLMLLALSNLHGMQTKEEKAEAATLATISFFEMQDKRNAAKWRNYIHNPKGYKGNRPYAGSDPKVVDSMFEAAVALGLLTETFTIPPEIANLVNAGKLN